MVMVGIPLLLDVLLIWWPTVSSILLSFTNWDGVGSVTAQNFIGLKNYQFMFSGYTLFWPAFLHNIIWLAWLALIATPLGIFFAVLLDREMSGTGFYQSVFFLPVVLSLVVVGFIWELQFSPTEGFINNAFGLVKSGKLIDWLGNPRINLYSILIAASWRHVGYVMVIYLAGLKSVDPTLREAAKVDGANEVRTFFRVVFPVMAPINGVIAAATRRSAAPTVAARGIRPGRVALHAFLIVMSGVWLFPLFWAVYSSLRPISDTIQNGYLSWPTGGLSLANYQTVWTQAELP